MYVKYELIDLYFTVCSGNVIIHVPGGVLKKRYLKSVWNVNFRLSGGVLTSR